MATLTEFLTNIANAIRSKKGTTEPINAQDFATEIESIEVGGGGNEIWTGTTLVSKEDVFIENIYVNTQLTIPEVVDMLSKLDYLDVDDVNQTYIAFVGENQDTQIGITRTLYQNEYVYNVMLVGDGDTYTLFSSKDIFEYGWEGFTPLITYPIAINTHGYSNINGLTIGTQNDLINNLVSSEDNFKKVKKENALKKLLNATKSAKYLFNGYKGTSVDGLIEYDDTENVTNFEYIFGNCYSLNAVPRLNTSNATVMSSYFNNCKGLTVIDTLDTHNCKEFTCIFYNCSNLTSIQQLNTDNAMSIMQAFQSCNKLTTIDLTSLDKISSSTYISNAFAHCYSLTKVIIRTMTKIPSGNSNMFNSSHHFTGAVDATYNPEGLKDGRIYVPDEWVEKLKTATNWSVYADCIVPLSTLEE